MLLNILIGFVIPWLFGFYLYKLAPKILLTIFPMGTVIAHIINSFADEYKVWDIFPEKYMAIDILLFDIGLYTILPSYLVFFIDKYKKVNSYIFIMIFAIFTTFSEFFWLKIERVNYNHGWNIYLTFLSYLIPYILIYFYYNLLKKKQLF